LIRNLGENKQSQTNQGARLQNEKICKSEMQVPFKVPDLVYKISNDFSYWVETNWQTHRNGL